MQGVHRAADHLAGRPLRVGRSRRPLAEEASAREDPYELRKAIDLYADEHALAWHPEVYIPKAGARRTRWLRLVEIDRIYWAIRGRTWDHATNGWKIETVADEDGNVVTRRVLRGTETIQARRALRRFVFIGLTTGTRNTAMRELRWRIMDRRGCFDLDGGLIHRRGFRLDPGKGRPRYGSRISARTVATLRRWRDADLGAGIDLIVHKVDGTPYASSRACICRSTMDDAGPGADMVPHTLRHTAATMLRVAGVDVRQGADLLGMAVQTMVRVYGQWTLEGQEKAADVLADTLGLRKAMPLLALVPTLPEPVVMGVPANDDAARGKGANRRRVDTAASRVASIKASVPARPPARLAIVA